MAVPTTRSLRTTMSVLAFCSTFAFAAPLYAQKANADEEKKVETDAADPVSGEDIIVTGTSISGVKPVGNEVIVVTAEDAVKTGYSTPADVLRTLPQVRMGEFDAEGGRSTVSPQNAVGANTVSLRAVSGAGNSSQTLILVNGRRQVSGGTNQTYTDANQVPLAALERIEIVSDGASAIYGSDAVGGVINYVLRKDYQGGEFRIRANNISGGLERGVDATLGTSWKLGGLGAGNILVSYGYTKRDAYTRGKNPFFRSDLRPLGGLDGRAVGAQPTLGYIPAIVVTPSSGGTPNPVFPRAGASTYYGLPDGANVGVTVGQLGVNDVDLIDNAFLSDYNGRMRRHQVTANISQQLGDSIEFYVQGSFSDRETHTRNLSNVTGVQLRSMLRDSTGATTTTPNPYYVYGVPGVSQGAPAGFITVPFFPFPIPVPATPAADLTVVLPQLRLGQQQFLGSDRSINVTAGVRADLPGNWKGDVFYTVGRNKGCTYCVVDGSYVNLQALQYQVDIGNINPLSSLPLTAAERATFMGTQRQIGHNGIDNFAARFNGPLFSLPGGIVRAAVGVEQIRNFAWNSNNSISGVLNVPTLLTDRANSYMSEKSSSAFGELYVPVVGSDMNIPLVESLVLSGAVRYDKYHRRHEDAVTPKFGFDWKVADIFSFRGSWSKSFRAPSMSETNPSAYVTGIPFFGFPLPGYNATPGQVNNADLRIACQQLAPTLCLTNVAILAGSNPNLKSENSTNLSLTGEFSPGGGLKISATYYKIKYNNRISFPGVLADFLGGPNPGGASPVYPLGYSDYIVPIHNPSTCVNTDLSTADPALQSYLQGPVYAFNGGLGQLGGLSNFCQINVIVDSRFTNLAKTVTDGLDINVSFNRDLGDDIFLTAAATANVIFTNTIQASPGGLVSEQTGTTEGPVKWRGRGNIGLAKDGFNATLFANYYGSFTNNQNISTPLGATAAPVKIPSYTTFDMTLGYGTDFAGRNSGFLKGLRGSFTVTNLFNNDPPIVLRSDRVTLEGHGAPFGRSFSFTLTGAF